MSPSAKTSWEQWTTWIMRISLAIIASCAAIGTNAFLKVQSNVDLILQDNNGMMQWKKDTERRVDRLENVVDRHAEAINKINVR